MSFVGGLQRLERIYIRNQHNLLKALPSISNCSTESCSGLISSKLIASPLILTEGMEGGSDRPSGLRELRIVFLRWLKVVLMTFLKISLSQLRTLLPLRRRRITADFTFGGGVKTFSLTVNRYSMSYHA